MRQGRNAGSGVMLAAGLLVALTASGCPSPKEKPPAATCASGTPSDAGTGAGFTKAALLQAFADCTVSRLDAFRASAQQLVDTTRALAASRTAENRTAARDAWKAAMARWEELELFRFGPAARSSEPGGQDLRDQIYGWPLVSRCRIEEQLVSRVYATPAFAKTVISTRGLAAAEYLLFFEGSENACSSFSTINAQGTWAALSAEELAQRRADYAAAVANDILGYATRLSDAWAVDKGNFRCDLVLAGRGSRVFKTDQDALNAVSDALFYVDLEVKDLKLGKPLGLMDCATATCPEALESQWAHVSTSDLRQNLLGFRQLFQGCGQNHAGLGFDDWLAQAGAGDLSTRMDEALTGAETSVDTLSPPIEEALVTDKAKVQAIRDAVKKLTDLLKTEFVSVLNLDLPTAGEGDND